MLNWQQPNTKATFVYFYATIAIDLISWCHIHAMLIFWPFFSNSSRFELQVTSTRGMISFFFSNKQIKKHSWRECQKNLDPWHVLQTKKNGNKNLLLFVLDTQRWKFIGMSKCRKALVECRKRSYRNRISNFSLILFTPRTNHTESSTWFDLEN